MRKTLVWCVLTIVAALPVARAQTAVPSRQGPRLAEDRRPLTLDALQFLLGDWQGEGSGAPGEGSGWFSFRRELDGKVLVRRNHTAYLATKERKEFLHEDLMVIYPAADEVLAAIYFDNEGHVIRYAAELSVDAKGVTFTSEPAAGPRFRLSYVRTPDGRLTIGFEIAPPGSAGFKPYLSGTARRK